MKQPDRPAPASRASDLDAVPLRHPVRWIVAVAVLFVAFLIVRSAVTNKNMRWDVVRHYLFDRFILDGLLKTLELTAVAMVIAIVVGVLVAIMRLSSNPALAGASWLYVWFLRGTPLLVQLLFWYFLAALFPRIGLGIRYGPTFFSWDTNQVIGQFSAAVLGLGLSEAAYMAETVRAGILSVNKGQTEAAHSLGLTRAQTLRRIVLPQAMRVIIPPTGNATISMLKTTSLVLVIALPDLLTSAQIVYSHNFLQIPLLTVACIWYLVVTSVLTVLQYFVERHFSRGSTHETPRGRASLWSVLTRVLPIGRRPVPSAELVS